MNPREQKNHRTSVASLAKGVEELAEATAEQFSTIKRQIGEERTRFHHQIATAVKLDAFLQRGFWSRLNWLVTGR